MSDQPVTNRARWLRIPAALLLLVAGSIAWELLRGAGSFSAARLAALAASLLLATGLTGIILGPGRWREGCCDFYTNRLDWMRSRQPTASRAWCWLAMAIAWLTFLVAMERGAGLQDLRTTDSAAFSRYASEVASEGGPLALAGMLYSGTYAEANQHPLLIGILSMFDNDVISHQHVTMVISLAGFIQLTLLVARLGGHQVAAVFAALLATNATLGHLSVQITCECLLIPLVTICWWSFQRWTEAENRAGPWRVMIGCGVVLGLVQLAKGTGPLFLAGTLAWLLLPACCPAQARLDLPSQDGENRTARHRGRMVLVLLAAWITIASPLLIRNVRIYGSPLYNVNSHFLFLDEFENPSEVASRITLGEAAKEYFATHSIGEMVQREVTGLAWESFNMARLLGPQPLEESRVLPGILLLLLALFGIGLSPGRGYLLVACWLLLMVPLFAWYDPIVRSGERFLAPLAPALLFYAATALCRLLSPENRSVASRARQNLVPIACIAWCLLWNGATWLRHGADLLSP